VKPQHEIAVSLLSQDHASDEDATPPPSLLPSKTPRSRCREVLAVEGGSPVLPIRVDARVKVVTAIARGRQCLSEIEIGSATIDGIAVREACSKRHVSMTISLAFLAPSLVKAAVDGRLPRGIGVVACSMLRSQGHVSNSYWGFREGSSSDSHNHLLGGSVSWRRRNSL
jgi:site-specific DNA recombinase